jgi:hypothetical protein
VSKPTIIPKERLERAISEGKTLLEVALSIGCSPATIGHRAKVYGLTWPEHHKNISIYFNMAISDAGKRRAIRHAYKDGTSSCPLA